MRIHELKPAEGGRKKSKRVGRGPGSGHGKTATKGHKGQKSRSGGKLSVWFEGGQMPLVRRVPKRGFNCPSTREYRILNLKDIERLGLDTVTPEELLERGEIRSLKDGLKVLGVGELSRAVTVKAHAFSASATRKIEASGGTAEVIV